MIRPLEAIADGSAYDVIVIGAGAGGFAAALFAAIEGQKTLLVERTDYLGGTTALSAGATWVPDNPHSRTANSGDSKAKALAFLDGVVGNHASRAMREAFLDSGHDAIAALETHSEVKYRLFAAHPDYEQTVEGATISGRVMDPLPFDGRLLGDAVKAIRPPIPEFTIFGGMMVDRTDIGHLLNLRNSRASFAHALKIIARYGQDRLKGSKRGTRLLMGNALVGRFLKSLIDRGVDIVMSTEVTSLATDGGGVSGVTVEGKGTKRRLSASRAVVLAGGGFGRDPKKRAAMLPADLMPYSPAAPGHTGAAQDIAMSIGAKRGDGAQENAFMAPVSVRKRADGSTAVFPHFVLDRSKPGTVCVDQRGERFVNESVSYHEFARAMIEAHKRTPTVPCYIITDRDGLRTYGLGMVRMGTSERGLKPYLADGYLIEGTTIAGLAIRLGMAPEALERTIEHLNAAAISGIDDQFGRGSTAYHRHNGDAAHKPNPTLGKIATGPYYAVKLYPGDIGAATGLAIDPNARVLDTNDQPIGRLYACGAEAQSIMGGTYPGPGITLGPAIVFGYRAIQHAVKAA